MTYFQLAGDITMETQTAVMGSEEEPSKQDESSQQDLFFLDDEGESSKVDLNHMIAFYHQQTSGCLDMKCVLVFGFSPTRLVNS